jgi:F-type H+-transporting ATPase subunit beta
MSQGTVVQVIGAVIDVEFSRQELPKIYDALEVEGEGLGFRSPAAAWRWNC